MEPRTPLCFRCHKTPEELSEYIEAGEEYDMSPSAYVKLDEGTYNPDYNTFCCTLCYIELGCPSRSWPEGWVAPKARNKCH
jgi:hypothetical protein